MSSAPVKPRNASIDLLRYVCAVIVVAIHTHPLTEFSAMLDTLWPQKLTVVAVPFFFAVSGYFYLQKLDADGEGRSPFFRTAKRTLAIYAFWTAPYYVKDFLVWGHTDVKSFAISCCTTFVSPAGSYYHFWFFPALLCSICLSTLLFRLRCKRVLIPFALLCYAVGCLGTSYYRLGERIPGLRVLFAWERFTDFRRILLMGFPFFVAGYVVWRLEQRGVFASKRKLRLALLLCAVVFAAEMVLVHVFSLQRSVLLTPTLYPLVVILLLFAVCNPCPQFSSLAAKSRVMANVTYFCHPLALWLIDLCSKRFAGVQPTETVQFVLAVLLCAALGAALSNVRDRRIRYFVS